MQLVSFGGQQLYRPGAYSVVNVKNNTPYTPGSSKVLAVIGSGTAGAPATPLYYNSPALASQQIGGTDALLLAQLAWEHGADLICFSLTDVATQATYAAQSTDASAVTLFTLKGLRWNTADNQINYTATAPTNGVQTITITDTSVTPNVVETYSLANTTAGVAAFINQVNAQSSLVQAVAGATSTTNAVATVGTAASFTGGTRTASTPTSVTAAINALQTEDVQGIITSATDSTTQSAIFAHCNTMSSVTNKRERRAFLGQPIGTTVAGYQTAMASFTSSGRATVAAPGIYRGVNGVNTLLSSAFTAACIAGLWAGRQTPADPVTFKFINCNGLEFNYLGTDLQPLVQSQVTAIERLPKRGYRVLRALTGDQSGTNLVELSVSDLVDVMARAVREQLETRFVGKASYNGIVSDIQQATATILESFKKQNWIVDGTDAFNNPLPAYRNITVTQAGTQYSVAYEIAPSLPVNYITITANVNV